MRRFISLLLVLCLLISMIPLSASASITAGAVTIPALQLINSALIGLGITYSTIENFGGWTTLVNSCYSHLDSLGWINSDGTISLCRAATGI